MMFVWQDSGDTVKTSFVRASGAALVSSSSSAWTLIQTLNPSAVASIDTQSLAGFNLIRCTIYGLTPATNNVTFRTQISTDGAAFSDWDNGTGVSSNSGAATQTGNTNTNHIGGGLISNTASDGGINGEIVLYNYNQSEKGFCDYKTSFFDPSNASYTRANGTLAETGTTARTHLRFIFSSGNITSGRIVVEGIA
jgi:hypothetical protein